MIQIIEQIHSQLSRHATGNLQTWSYTTVPVLMYVVRTVLYIRVDRFSIFSEFWLASCVMGFPRVLKIVKFLFLFLLKNLVAQMT